MLTRRSVLKSSVVIFGLQVTSYRPSNATDLPLEGKLRGSLNAVEHGIKTNSEDDQSAKLQKLLNDAAAKELPLFLPPGYYKVSNINLPDGARLLGIAGATHIVLDGPGFLFKALRASLIELTGLTIDGGMMPLPADINGLLHLSSVNNLKIEDCAVKCSTKYGLWMEQSSGHIFHSRFQNAELAGIFAVNSSDLKIESNDILECGNGGILIHRWDKGPDGTIVTGNTVRDIMSTQGGTGQNGNGINVFKADDVRISNNTISNCAFSAIRSNSGSGVQILGNQCHNSGETAIYSEFGFEGAIVANNIINGAANGISIVNFNEGGRLAIVNGNIIRNLSLLGPYPAQGSGFGIGISVEADTIVSNNVIENAPKWAMSLGWGPYLRNVNVSGNIIRSAPVGVAVSIVEGVGSTLISSNQFSDIATGAILGFRWNDIATHDLVAGGDSPNNHIVISNNIKS